MSDTLVYFKNGIGNFVEMTPAIQAVASLDPSGMVDILLDSQWQDSRRPAFETIVREWHIIDRVVQFPREPLPKKYSRWFYCRHAEASDGYKLFESKMPLFGHRINWKKMLVHETEYYMKLARELGYNGPTPGQVVPHDHGPELRKARPRIGLCNGAFGLQRPAKEWHHFPALAVALRAAYPELLLVKVGNGNELSDVGGADEDFVGKISIVETAHVISQLDLLVTTDTGLMHVADALDIPQVVLFGATSVAKNGPLSKKAAVVRAGKSCIPCQYTSKMDTCKTRECMHDLSVEMVMDTIRRKLP